jgi:hypothetical protein
MNLMILLFLSTTVAFGDILYSHSNTTDAFSAHKSFIVNIFLFKVERVAILAFVKPNAGGALCALEDLGAFEDFALGAKLKNSGSFDDLRLAVFVPDVSPVLFRLFDLFEIIILIIYTLPI